MRCFFTSIKSISKLSYTGICLALAMLLPFITGQVPQIGSALCPMHLPILLCGFICGPCWAAMAGAVAPILRFALFGMPLICPAGLAMCFELAAYGFFAGIFYKSFPRSAFCIYLSLFCAMFSGRLVYGVAAVIIYGIGGEAYTLSMFVAGAFLNAVPGMILQIVTIPLIVMALEHAGLSLIFSRG